jgi:dTDP-4-dehydrorhamnose 3,5-epimerase
MSKLDESELIKGVFTVDLVSHADGRGRFQELFRKEWFPFLEWRVVQSNRSESEAGVLRGLHYHRRQVDYWYLIRGTILAGLADLRRSSPTYLATQTIRLSDASDMGLLIPTGVAHGFYAQTTATLIYIVDQYYDGNDEFGVYWNDPTLSVKWGVKDPILSPRDIQNPKLSEIPFEELPG